MDKPTNVRTVDELGRVVIPNEMRKKLDIGAGSKVEMVLLDAAVYKGAPHGGILLKVINDEGEQS